VVGSGVGPSYLVIHPPNSPTETASTRIYECEVGQLYAFVFFTDGTSGNFTGRVIWSSSAPNTVEVSNGDIPVAGVAGQNYSAGVLLPHAPGSAFITASYQGLSITYRVDVGTPDNFRLTDLNLNPMPDPAYPSFQQVRVGTGTSQGLRVIADVDGVPEDLTGSATWAFDQDSPGIALLSQGTITGVGPGGPLTARVSFATCDTTLTVPVTVANIPAIVIKPEFPIGNLAVTDSPEAPSLIVGNTELLNVYAQYGDGGPDQDVSILVSFEQSDPSFINISLGVGGDPATALIAGGPVSITAIANFAGQTQISSPTIQLSTIDGTLQAVTACLKPVTTPPEGCVASASLTGGSVDTLQLQAVGTFALSDGTTAVQDITRRVTWTVDEPAFVTLGSTRQTAGQASAAVDTTFAVGQATVTATDNSATLSTTSTIDLDIN